MTDVSNWCRNRNINERVHMSFCYASIPGETAAATTEGSQSSCSKIWVRKSNERPIDALTAFLHPEVVDGQNRAALQVRVSVTGRRDGHSYQIIGPPVDVERMPRQLIRGVFSLRDDGEDWRRGGQHALFGFPVRTQYRCLAGLARALDAPEELASILGPENRHGADRGSLDSFGRHE